MRFKASIRNISVFTKLTTSLSSLGKVVWIGLDDQEVRFTVIPDQGAGTQVWAVLPKDTLFEFYTIQSASPRNAINLQVPLSLLSRALRSALTGSSASIRLTKQDNTPLLVLTIITNTFTSSRLPPIPTTTTTTAGTPANRSSAHDSFTESNLPPDPDFLLPPHDRETTITQSIPVQVLAASVVTSIHEPRCPDPDVHIILPPLLQLKSISDRFTKLALSSTSPASGGSNTIIQEPPPSHHYSSSTQPRLTLSANMHGVFRIGLITPALKIESRWQGLTNPELDAAQIEGGEEGVREHASTRMKEKVGDEAWATVRVEGRDWGRVLGVGRLGGRVIAAFCHDHALILYVYLANDDSGADESVLTYYITSYSE